MTRTQVYNDNYWVPPKQFVHTPSSICQPRWCSTVPYPWTSLGMRPSATRTLQCFRTYQPNSRRRYAKPRNSDVELFIPVFSWILNMIHLRVKRMKNLYLEFCHKVSAQRRKNLVTINTANLIIFDLVHSFWHPWLKPLETSSLMSRFWDSGQLKNIFIKYGNKTFYRNLVHFWYVCANREGSINVIFKIIMTVNTTEDTPQIEVATVIQAIQSEANRQLQEAVTGLLQKLITLSLDNQTLGKVQPTDKECLPHTSIQ